MKSSSTNFTLFTLLSFFLISTAGFAQEYINAQQQPTDSLFSDSASISRFDSAKKPIGDPNRPYDYYLLALSWSPEFCLSHPTNTEQCGAQQNYQFIVHGLWPQFELKSNDPRGWPEFCAKQNGRPTQVPQDLIQSIFDVMPGSVLVQHEWEKHGTCSEFNDPQGYFNAVRKIYEGLVFPDSINQGKKKPIAVSTLIADFQTSNHAPDHSVLVACTQGSKPAVVEVRFCMSKSLDFIPCPNDVLKQGCSESSKVVFHSK